MPLEQTYPTPAGGGIKQVSVGRIIKDALESTYDQSKSLSTPAITAAEIYFEWSNQNLSDESVPDTRPLVVRVHSGRTRATDLEIGVNMITYRASPAIHVYALDPKATENGEGSDLLEDMAQYIRAWVADNVRGLQNKGIHSMVAVEENYLSNNDDPNWHHWTLQLEIEYELYRTPS